MSAGQGTRIVPPWTYRPGPDVAIDPPPGLVKAQGIAKGAAAAGIAALRPGISEKEIELAVGAYLAAEGIAHVWTITNVGLGENAKICFPTHPPTDNLAGERDLAMIDVHPITPDGFWGDCTRCGITGDYPEARGALADLTAIHHETLASCRPGMPASALFGLSQERLTGEGFVLLDLLANIGHSLSPGAAYLHQFIDAGNDTPMWGAWAVEPFVARDGIAVKVEDLVWFGRDACTVL